VAQSYDHLYGARPLRRWLEHSIITPLSRMIISGAHSCGVFFWGGGGGAAAGLAGGRLQALLALPRLQGCKALESRPWTLPRHSCHWQTVDSAWA
jgi:hypothetical protein